MTDPKAYKMRVQELLPHLESFKLWLSQRGAELLPLDGADEVLRFRSERGTSVIYKNHKGILTFFSEAEEAYKSFQGSGGWRANRVRARRGGGCQQTTQDLNAIIARDGDLCFYCQLKVHLQDATVEHLVARTHGGPNHISNKFLAHAPCNAAADVLSAPEKIRLHVNKVIERLARRLLEESK